MPRSNLHGGSCSPVEGFPEGPMEVFQRKKKTGANHWKWGPPWGPWFAPNSFLSAPVSGQVNAQSLEKLLSTPPKSHMSPKKGPCLKGKFIFQPSIFRYVSLQGKIDLPKLRPTEL